MSEDQKVDQSQPVEEQGGDFVVEPVSDEELEDVSGGLIPIDDGGCSGGSGCSDGFC